MKKIIQDIEDKKMQIKEYLIKLGEDFEHFNKLLSDENVDQYYSKDRYSKI